MPPRGVSFYNRQSATPANAVQNAEALQLQAERSRELAKILAPGEARPGIAGGLDQALRGLLSGMQTRDAKTADEQAVKAQEEQRRRMAETIQGAVSSIGQGGDMNAMAALLAGNPDTAQFGLQTALAAQPKPRVSKMLTPEEEEQALRIAQGKQRPRLLTPEEEAQQLRIRQAGKPETTVSVGQSEYGTIPPGYHLNRDPQTGALSMAPIPGGPVADKQAKEAEQTALREQQAAQYADVVTEDIDRIFGVVKDAVLPTTGLGGSFLSNFPNTAAFDIGKMLDTVKANAGFDRLQQMRNQSPTGGALGQVSEFENRLLQATIGNLEQSQSQEQFLFNLSRVKRIYSAVVNRGLKPEDLQSGEYGAPSMGDGPAIGAIEGGYVFMGGDPSSPENWFKAR